MRRLLRHYDRMLDKITDHRYTQISVNGYILLSAERDKLLARIDELAKIQPIQPNEDNQDGKED